MNDGIEGIAIALAAVLIVCITLSFWVPTSCIWWLKYTEEEMALRISHLEYIVGIKGNKND